MNFKNTLLRGVPNVGLLFLVFIGSHKAIAGSESVETERWVEAFQYLEDNGYKEAFLGLKDQALKAQASDQAIATYVFEYLARQRDRKSITEYAFELSTFNGCDSQTNRPRLSKAGEESKIFCQWLKSFWADSLANLLFYDSSAPQLEAFRQFMEQKDCPNAKLVLEQLEVREGEFLWLLNNRLRVAECLEDNALKARVLARLKELEI